MQLTLLLFKVIFVNSMIFLALSLKYEPIAKVCKVIQTNFGFYESLILWNRNLFKETIGNDKITRVIPE